MNYLNVKIITPRKVLLTERVKSISSKNSLGRFDILPYHANFITITEHSPILLTGMDDKVLSFNFPLAIIYTKANQVNIYTEIQLPQI